MAGFLDALGGGVPVNFQQASSLQQSLSPVEQAAPQMGPPSTPQELEQRRSGWQDFMHKLQNDPSVRTAAFMTAAQLMRGPDVGETMAGGIGRAIQLGTLAHSFMGSNQQRQMLEQQKLDETRKLNEANIAQTQMQTQGMAQTQRHAEENQPLNLEGKQLKNSIDQFTVDNQPQLLQDQLANSASNRKLQERHGLHYLEPNNTAGGVQGLQFSREDKLMRTANPPMEGETPQAYEQRIAQLTLGRTAKNQDAVAVQAAQAILRDGDPGTPEYLEALDVMRSVAQKSAPKKAAGTVDPAWQKARDAVKVGESYTGPDGNTYIRKN